MASDTRSIPPKNRQGTDGYSATVDIELHTEDGVFYPTQTADDRILFLEPQFIRPGTARLVILIDGVAQVSTVEILPHESPSECIPVRIVSTWQ